MIEKLLPYAEIIASGEVPDDRIAEMAGVSVEEVAAARSGSNAPAAPPAAPEAPETPETPPAEPPKVEKAKKGPKAEKGPKAPEAPSPPPAAPQVADASAVDAPPACVRATASFTTTQASGRTWYVGFRGVYTGAEAARLWTLHRDKVEVFPPAKG